MNILYMHGLDGSLADDKRSSLMMYGEVFAPQIDYRSSEDVFNALVTEYKDKNIEVVIGNSMGGLGAYYISQVFNRPCLAFNPALPYSSVVQILPINLALRDKYLQIVIGWKDDVIKAKDTVLFLEENAKGVNYNLHIHSLMGHRVPISEFRLELKHFFDHLKGC